MPIRTPDFWHTPSPGLAAALLAPLAGIWASGASARRLLSSPPVRAALPTLCVGNLTVGGAGKTPVVMDLVQRARALGWANPACLASGYGGSQKTPAPVPANACGAEACRLWGDEASLLVRCGPTWVGRPRAAAIATMAQAGHDLAILDDGLQDYSLAHDLRLAIIDAERGFGNGWLMPAGPLREPIRSGLRRSDAVILMHPLDGQGRQTEKVLHEAQACDRMALHARLVPDPAALCTLAGRPTVAFAGIGIPDKFFAMLRSIGFDLRATVAFADHHRYRLRDLERLHHLAERVGSTLLTTAKDWVRLPPAWQGCIAVLPVTLAWDDDAATINGWLIGLRDRHARR
jgi:tetraacyldisaccharide 4'-kinase